MGRAAWGRRKTALLIAVALLACGVGVVAYETSALGRSELQTIDARYSFRGTQRPPSSVALVLIGPNTFQELKAMHLHSEFPFPRAYEARVIDRLRESGATVIGMDIQFTQPTDEADDQALAGAIERARGKVILATEEVALNGETRVFGGNAVLRELGARAASIRLPFDSDGAIRRFPYAYNKVRSFPVAAVEVARGHPLGAERFEHGELPIDFVGPPETFPSISFAKVLAGDFPASRFRGKIVIVGASAPILHDVHDTATGSGMAGSEILANATATLLRGAPLTDAPDWLNVLAILLLGSVAPLISLRLARLRALLTALFAGAVFAIVVQLAFDSGLIVSLVYPLLALFVATFATLLVLYLSEAIERERTHDLFSRFVPSQVVDEVIARTDRNLRLGAVERDCTVMFSDLRGFTSFSESQPAKRVIEVVNWYLNEMSEAILGAGGTLVAYMGDGIMAVFGAPLEQPDHADRAVAAAMEMVGPRLGRFNDWLADEGFDRRFEMGVGINSGPVMAGNVGSERRLEYTAIGDTTNTASRLESMTKQSEAMLFIADSTRERMHDDAAERLSPVGEFEVRGRSSKLVVWTIRPLDATAPSDGNDARRDHASERAAEDETATEGGPHG
jgi:adenylate cyclase